MGDKVRSGAVLTSTDGLQHMFADSVKPTASCKLCEANCDNHGSCCVKASARCQKKDGNLKLCATADG